MAALLSQPTLQLTRNEGTKKKVGAKGLACRPKTKIENKSGRQMYSVSKQYQSKYLKNYDEIHWGIDGWNWSMRT